MLSLIFSMLWAQPPDKALINQKRKELAPFRSLFLASTHPLIPEEAYQKLANGDIITGVVPKEKESSKIGWGIGIFPINIEKLWAALNNGDKHAGYTPVNYAEIIEGEPCTDKRKIFMTLPIPVLPDRWWVSQSRTNPKLLEQSKGAIREMSWKNVSDPEKILPPALQEKIKNMIQIPFAEGAWVLLDLGNGYTLGEYHTWAHAGGNVPSGLTEIFIEKSVYKTMRAIERFSQQAELICLSQSK